MILRGYQTDAVEAVERYWREGKGTAPLVVAPTGSGKSIMIAALIARRIVTYREYSPPYRVMLATHVKELVEQDVRAMEGYDADLRDRIAIWSASLQSSSDPNTGGSCIIAGTIQTIARRLKRITEPIDLLVVDEAHLIPTREQSQYRKLIAHLKALNPQLRMVGFTATPYRLDQGFLHHGQGATFDGIAHNVGFRGLVDNRHLVPAKPRWDGISLDVDTLRTRAGEFTAESQSQAMDLERMVSDALKSGGGGHHGRWLWFLPSVETAHSAALTLRQGGYLAATVHGAMPTPERDAVIDTFRRGEIEHLTNCALMTTGFDIPEIDRVVLARATKSTALYVQMVGRGLRPVGNKEHCIVLDYGGNVMRHGPVDDPQPSVERRGRKKGKAAGSVMRQCDGCGAFIPRSERVCPECGHAPTVYFNPLNAAEIMFENVDGSVFEVVQWKCQPWNVGRTGRIPCVRATFWTRPRGKIYRKWYFPAPGSRAVMRREYLKTWEAVARGDLLARSSPPSDPVIAAREMERLWPCPSHVMVERGLKPKLPEITPIYERKTA